MYEYEQQEDKNPTPGAIMGYHHRSDIARTLSLSRAKERKKDRPSLN